MEKRFVILLNDTTILQGSLDFVPFFSPLVQFLVFDRVELGVAARAADICRESTLRHFGHPHERSLFRTQLTDLHKRWISVASMGFQRS